MKATAVSDAERVEALKRLRVRNTPLAENPFAQIVETVSELFDMPNVAIHLLDDEEQWVKALIGDRFECSVENSFCQYALDREDSGVWVVPDAAEHSLFRDHPLVTGGRIRFYAVAPLVTSDGYRVGTLCLTDPTPREGLDAAQRKLLEQFASIVMNAMELRKDFHEVRSALTDVTEVDGVTGLTTASAFLKQAYVMRAHAAPESRVAFVRVEFSEVDTLKQFSGESGLNRAYLDLARRLSADLLEDEVLIRAGDGDFVFVRYFARDGGRAGPLIEEWAGERCAAVDRALAESVRVDDKNFYLKARFGLAEFAVGGVDPVMALDAVKIALQRAQKPGAGGASWYRTGLPEEAAFLSTAEHGLREAVSERRLQLAFQPIVSIGSGGTAVCGAEALLRWPDQREPVLGPADFIPMAEEKGLMGEIGLWVFEEACATLARWRKHWPIWLSVNVSPSQFADDSLPERFVSIASEAGIRPEQIKLEITESALVGDFAHVRDMLIRLREAGFPLALDDFGTGHSSLARVIQLPFDQIKVDRAFVSDAPSGPGAAVVSAVLHLSRSLRMGTIAEGVESAEHERFLLGSGYELAQGYLYAPPMFAQDFEAWLSAQSIDAGRGAHADSHCRAATTATGIRSRAIQGRGAS